MTELCCPSCKAPVAPDDLSLRLGTASCRACQKVFQLGPAERPPAPRPPAWSEGPEGADWLLVRRWRTFGSVFPVLFATVWNGIIWTILVAQWSGAVEPHGKEGPLPFSLAIVPHTLVGLGVGYWALARLFNVTTVRLSPQHLEVSHGPLPWPGASVVPISKIRQLYVEESSVRVNHRATYNLVWLDGEGVGRRLLRYASTIGEMRWVEQQIEGRLGIRDVAVNGEVGR